jgi:hypothetical protein
MIKSKTPVDRAHDLYSLLRVLSLAVDGEQIAGLTFNASGGGRLLDMAAGLAFDILGDLERAEMRAR